MDPVKPIHKVILSLKKKKKKEILIEGDKSKRHERPFILVIAASVDVPLGDPHQEEEEPGGSRSVPRIGWRGEGLSGINGAGSMINRPRTTNTVFLLTPRLQLHR